MPNWVMEEYLYHVSRQAVAFRAAEAARNAALTSLVDSVRASRRQGATVEQRAKAADQPAADIERMLAS